MTKSYVDLNLIPIIDDLITRDRAIVFEKMNRVMFQWEVKLSKKLNVKIQICNGKPLYVQAVLFDGNTPVQKSGPHYNFFNNYKFEYNGKKYYANVLPESA